MVERERLLGIIRSKGPVIPVQIAKEVETSILFASAMLSELVSAKLVKVSGVKIGGSPLYYLPEQKSQLQNFSKHLPQKEREAYDILKNSKVLRESEQEPAIKVALRNMKDFSWPLKVTVGNQPEIFWKWYLLSNEEAGEIIKKKLGAAKPQPEQQKPAEQKPPVPAPIEKPHPEIKPEQPKVQEAPKPQISEQNPIEPKKQEPQTEQPEPKLEQKTPETQQKLAEEEKSIKKESAQKASRGSNAFTEQIMAFFSQSNIKVLNQEIIRKNEVDFIVELQSTVGNLKYYCKAKEKKRIGDADLSSAYVQGELKKLPVLFLSTGEPSKRAKEMLGKEFQNIVYKQIGGGFE